MKRGFRSEVAVGLVVLVIFVLGAIFFSDLPPLERLQSLRTWQEADAPPGYPVEVGEAGPDGRVPVFEGQFVLLDGFERFRVPPVSRLTQPLGSEHGAFAHALHSFFEPMAGTPDRSLGEDLVGIGGAARDEGDPVFAVGNGVVGQVADRGGAGGKVVLIGHRLPDGRIMHSLYGNLAAIDVSRGALVARGQRIGTVKNAPDSGPDRLHFEMVDGPLLDPGPGSGAAPLALNRRSPSETIAARPGPSPADLAPEPLAVYEAEAQVFKIGPDGIPVPLEK